MAVIAESEPQELQVAINQAFDDDFEPSSHANVVSMRYRTLENPTSLAEDIGRLRSRLATPMRIAATLLSAITLGGTSAGLRYAIEPGIHNQPEQIATKDHPSPIEVGLLGGVAGGIYGGLTGMVLSGREARRRARKKVSKT
jgi:hypothetical protein